MAFQKPYGSKKRVKVDTGDGLTEQAHKRETDMNYILKDYQRTGLIKHAKNNQGKYDDIDVQDFQEAMITVASANSMFSELPANIRKRFQNNPSEFLEFVHNPGNAEEMRKLGILQGNDGLDISGAASGAPIPAPDVPSPASLNPDDNPPAV